MFDEPRLTELRKALLLFLRDWDRARLGEDVPGMRRVKSLGLCMSVGPWCDVNLDVCYFDLRAFLRGSLPSPHTEWPFGRSDYYNRAAEKTMHECPNRIAWVHKTIEELERSIAA